MGTAVSAGATIRYHAESPSLLLTQRDRGTIDPDFERIPPERAAQECELGAFDEAEDHQTLHRRIEGVDRFDTGAITGFEIRKCQASGSAPMGANRNRYYLLLNPALNQMDGGAR
jgi:hypothetical protein